MDAFVLVAVLEHADCSARRVSKQWNAALAPRQRQEALQRTKDAQKRKDLYGEARRKLADARLLLEFVASPREHAVLPTANSFHRRTLHMWARAFGLLHETAATQESAPRQWRLKCPQCGSLAVHFQRFDQYEMTLRCRDCQGHSYTGSRTRTQAWADAILHPQPYIAFRKPKAL